MIVADQSFRLIQNHSSLAEYIYIDRSIDGTYGSRETGGPLAEESARIGCISDRLKALNGVAGVKRPVGQSASWSGLSGLLKDINITVNSHLFHSFIYFL